MCFLESPNFTSRDCTSGGPPVYKIIRIVGIIRIMGFIGGRVFLEETQYLEAILADIDLKRKNAYNNTNFCKSLLQVRGRHVYKHESDDRWIGMCPGQWLGRLGWCIGISSTMETKGPVAYGKIMHLKKTEMKVECYFKLILILNLFFSFNFQNQDQQPVSPGRQGLLNILMETIRLQSLAHKYYVRVFWLFFITPYPLS